MAAAAVEVVDLLGTLANPEFAHLAHSQELLRSLLTFPSPGPFSTQRGWTMSRQTVHSKRSGAVSGRSDSLV